MEIAFWLLFIINLVMAFRIHKTYVKLTKELANEKLQHGLLKKAYQTKEDLNNLLRDQNDTKWNRIFDLEAEVDKYKMYETVLKKHLVSPDNVDKFFWSLRDHLKVTNEQKPDSN